MRSYSRYKFHACYIVLDCGITKISVSQVLVAVGRVSLYLLKGLGEQREDRSKRKGERGKVEERQGLLTSIRNT